MRSSSQLIPLQLADLRAGLRRTEGGLPAGIHIAAVDLPGDLVRISALHNAALGLEGEDALTPKQLADFTRHPGLDLTGAFLAFEGDLAVGVGVGSVEVPAPGGSPRRGVVELLAVLPEHRRQGIGRALLHTVLDWLAEQGVTTVLASVEDLVPLTMLQRYGFAQV